MQLFCFTFAGGTAEFFNQLEDICTGKIDFVKLEYPGHGSRRKEKLCDTFQELAEDLYGQLKENYSGSDYALLGYSMGSIAVLESVWMDIVRKIWMNILKIGQFSLAEYPGNWLIIRVSGGCIYHYIKQTI